MITDCSVSDLNGLQLVLSHAIFSENGSLDTITTCGKCLRMQPVKPLNFDHQTKKVQKWIFLNSLRVTKRAKS